MAKGGRPTSFKPEYVDQARKLVKLGAIDTDLADFFGVSEQTINAWKKANAGFFEALKESKAALDAQVEQSLFRRAMGYTHEAVKIFADPKTGAELVVPYVERYPPDTTACIFWLKNRKPAEWRDRIEHTGKDGGAIALEALVTQVAARRGKSS